MADLELAETPTETPTKKPRKPRKPKTEPTPEVLDVQEDTQEAQGEADDTQNVQSTVETPEASQNASQTRSVESGRIAELEAFEAKVKAAALDVKEADAEIERISGLLKSAKKRKETLVEIHCQICEEGSRQHEPMPLFDRKPDLASKPAAKLHEPWREWPLAEIGLTASIVEKLAEAGYSTAGQIADFNNTGGMLSDIAGIGEATADKISDALAEMHRLKPWEADASVGLAEAMNALNGEVGDEEPGDAEVYEEDELD